MINNELQKQSKSIGWKYLSRFIKKEFEFRNFSDSIKFVNNVADKSESLNHHPEMTIKYNKVTIILYSHDKQSVTDKDIELAGQIDFIYKNKSIN